MKQLLPFLLLGIFSVPLHGQQSYDLIIYGGTPSGVAAATNAGREGLSVALVEETYQVGGLTSGGLAHTDFKTFQSLGGSWKEFMDRVQDHYKSTYGEGSPKHAACARGAYSEPKVARDAFMAMHASAKVTILLNHQLVSAESVNNRVISATFVPADSSRGYPQPKNEPTISLQAKVFIDATYEGDLIAAAGVKRVTSSMNRSLRKNPTISSWPPTSVSASAVIRKTAALSRNPMTTIAMITRKSSI